MAEYKKWDTDNLTDIYAVTLGIQALQIKSLHASSNVSMLIKANISMLSVFTNTLDLKGENGKRRLEDSILGLSALLNSIDYVRVGKFKSISDELEEGLHPDVYSTFYAGARTLGQLAKKFNAEKEEAEKSESEKSYIKKK